MECLILEDGEDGSVTPGQENPNAEPNPASDPSGDQGSPTGSTVYNEASFKGLQRRISAEQGERRKLEQQILQLNNRNANDPLISSLLQELNAVNPQRAQEVANAVSIEQIRQENTALKTQQAQTQWEKVVAEAEAENIAALREIVEALGVEPDSKLIDYGDSQNDSMPTRMKKVKQDALEAKKVTNVKPAEPRSVATGTAHNTQQGNVVVRTADKTSITDDELQAAQREFDKNPRSLAARQKLEKAIELAQI